MRAGSATAALALALVVAGCLDEAGPLPVPEPAPASSTGWIEVRSGTVAAPPMCAPAGDQCIVGIRDVLMADILPNTTARAIVVEVSSSGSYPYELDWRIDCLEPSCPSESLASGHDTVPFTVNVSGLDVSGAYLRMALDATNTFDGNFGLLDADDISIRGGIEVEWGPPLVEVVRQHELTLTTGPCLEGTLDCNPGTSQPARIQLAGVARAIEMEAEWTALSPSEEQLMFMIRCIPGCAEEFQSPPVASPARFSVEVNLMGEVLLRASVSYALGAVYNAAGTGTTIQVTLRTYELVPG